MSARLMLRIRSPLLRISLNPQFLVRHLSIWKQHGTMIPNNEPQYSTMLFRSLFMIYTTIIDAFTTVVMIDRALANLILYSIVSDIFLMPIYWKHVQNFLHNVFLDGSKRMRLWYPLTRPMDQSLFVVPKLCSLEDPSFFPESYYWKRLRGICE